MGVCVCAHVWKETTTSQNPSHTKVKVNDDDYDDDDDGGGGDDDENNNNFIKPPE